MGVKERILEFCDFMKIKPSRFERMCGLSNGYLNQLRHEPSREKLEAILAVFPQLNKEWLLTKVNPSARTFISYSLSIIGVFIISVR